MTDLIRIANDHLGAEFSPLGAEMRSLRDEHGRDLLSDGPPAFWTGRAPLLFPVVGAVNGDIIRVDGTAYPMEKHGFARRSTFTPVDVQADRATFRLEADDDTRKHYPFGFRLDIVVSVDGPSLTTEAVLSNPNDVPLPASFGFHPAFRWPLPWGGSRAEHRLVFPQDEPAPIRRIDTVTGLVLPEAQPTPVEEDTLAPRDDLFEPDALIFDRLRSRSVRFGVPGGRMIEVAFPDMPLLGVWTKPGAPFLCIEPWQGLADPVGYQGDLREKPYVVEVAPGDRRSFAMIVTLDAPR